MTEYQEKENKINKRWFEFFTRCIEWASARSYPMTRLGKSRSPLSIHQPYESSSSIGSVTFLIDRSIRLLGSTNRRVPSTRVKPTPAYPFSLHAQRNNSVVNGTRTWWMNPRCWYIQRKTNSHQHQHQHQRVSERVCIQSILSESCLPYHLYIRFTYY